MKSFFIFIVLLFTLAITNAQTKMLINKTNGATDTIALASIKSITFSTIPVPKDSLVAYYPFNGNANDSSGNGHHGNAFGVVSATNRFGKLNSCYQFTGSNSYVTIPQHTGFDLNGSNSISISCWMKSDSIQRHGSALWCKATTGGTANYCFTFHGALDIGDSMNTTVNMNSANQSQIPTFYVGKVNSWHHLVVVFENLKCSIYSDGILIKEGTFNKSPIINSGNLYFGDDSDGGDEYYKGLLDDVRIYKRKLTLLEVQSLFQESGS